MNHIIEEPAKSLLRGPEAAKRLGIGFSNFQVQVKAGKLPQPIRVSPRRPMWRVADLDAVVQAL